MAKASKALQKASKYVYLFGNGKADGDGSMKALLGGKGANLAEMSRIGLPVPPGFTITTEVCTYYYAHKKTYPKDLQGSDQSRHRSNRKNHGHEIRRQEEHAAARVGPLRRARFDAGHDGHDPQSWPERRHRSCAGRRPRRTNVLPGIAIGASSRCTATSSWACRNGRTKIMNRSKS